MSTNTFELRMAAWVSVISLFLVGWGESTWTALRIAWGMGNSTKTFTVQHEVSSLIVNVGVAGTAWALIVLFRKLGSSTSPRVSLRIQLKVVPVVIAVQWLGFQLYVWMSSLLGIDAHGFPSQKFDSTAAHILGVLDVMMAGPAEELVLMALVVTALRTVGYGWWPICFTAIAVRVPFHFYYGWGALTFSVWAALVVVLYRRTNALLGIIIAHAMFNGLSFADDFGSFVKGALVLIGFFLVLVPSSTRLLKNSGDVMENKGYESS